MTSELSEEDKENFTSLIELIRTLQKRVSELEAEQERLKQGVIKMVTVDESFETPYTTREVVQMLFNWANSA